MRLNLICIFFIYSTAWAQKKTTDWFIFEPEKKGTENSIDLSSWLDKPAGKHGFLQIKGKDFSFEDGTPVKFWGVNICSDEPFAEEEKIKQWVLLLTKYGINGIRFHKFTWHATDGIHSTQLTPDKWKSFDFFCNELRKAGVYYSWSHIYGHKVMKADSARLLAYNEVKNTSFSWSHLNGTTASLVNFADDLQSLNIELTVNMLNHVNPHTNKTYANDPALSFIELQNEDNIFWGAIEETLKQTPAYRKLLNQKFSRWLKQKYSTEQALREAWNNQGLSPGESLDQENIYPHPNHGLFSHEYELALKQNRSVPTHIADRAAFLFDEQMKFYNRFITAIRNTGYKGVIVGSCWQAGSGITHFYNLYADYNAGAIDRHNYYGGGIGHQLKPGKFDNASMLSNPGSGLLSTGFQMVADRPFQISEWMSLVPTEWVAESSPIIAMYGMGLQGWDASYAFAMDYTHFTSTIQSGHGVYNVTSPSQLSLYPALAAMIYRGDVKEGEPIANRNINVEELESGQLSFIEKTAQQYDVKSFQSSVPLEALAIGPVTVSFNAPDKNLKKDFHSYWNKEQKIITSNTQQLKWHYGKKDYFTINTAGTKGIVGFAPQTYITLGNISIKTSNDFAVILISSLEKDKDLETTNKILVTTIARAQNTGMKFNEEKTELLDIGRAPVLLEPVQAELIIKRKGKPEVHVLDHSGNRVNQKIAVKDGKIHFDGSKYKAIYYEISY